MSGMDLNTQAERRMHKLQQVKWACIIQRSMRGEAGWRRNRGPLARYPGCGEGSDKKPGFSIASGELDIAGEVLPGWNIIANYAFTDADII